MLERLKIVWYVLTKKEYIFYAIDRREYKNSGAVSYYRTHDTQENTLFLSTVQEDIENLKSKL